MKLAIPNKGRLHEDALDLLRRAGLRVRFNQKRALIAKADGGNVQVLLLRASDIPQFVHEGVVDAGITGRDVVLESGHDLTELLPLGYGACRLSLAMPRDRAVDSPEDLDDGVHIATSFPRLTERFLDEHKVKGTVVPVSGAAEIAPHIGVADCIVDLVSTGSTLTAHNLVEVATLVESEAILVTRTSLLEDDFQRGVIEELQHALESVIQAKGRRYLMANVQTEKVEAVKQVLPGISAPTVLNLLDRDDLVAVHAVVTEAESYGIVKALKELGATGILVLPIQRLVP